MPGFDTVVFDVGNVLLRWDPRVLFRTFFDDEDEVERFLRDIWTPAHNHRCDLGEPFATVIAEVVAEHPRHADAVRAAHDRWIETIPGAVEGALELLEELRDLGYRLLGLTNFSHETFPLVHERYPHFALLDEIVVSGRVGLAKPDPAIYHLLFERSGAQPGRSLFVDDSPANVAAARAVGMEALLFVGVDALRDDLRRLGLGVREAGAHRQNTVPPLHVSAVAASDVVEALGDVAEAAGADGVHEFGEDVVAGEGGVS